MLRIGAKEDVGKRDAIREQKALFLILYWNLHTVVFLDLPIDLFLFLKLSNQMNLILLKNCDVLKLHLHKSKKAKKTQNSDGSVPVYQINVP